MKTLLHLLPLGIVLCGLPSATVAAPSLGGQIVQRAGITRGVAAVVGLEGNLPLELVRASELLVHARDADAAAVYALRQVADKQGIGLDRLVAESGPVSRLPYADNTIDVLVVDRDGAGAPAITEVMRALRPEGITFIRSGAKGANWRTADGGHWRVHQKPPLAGARDWSHWENQPDNNPVSADSVIKAPYMSQFLAEPHYIAIPSVTVAAGGRTFLAVGHIAHHEREWEGMLRLIARNGYNGQILWERRLPDGYFVHRSAFIATRDTFYLIDGDHCLLLDAQTGVEKGRLRMPDTPGDWKWMALHDNKLYALLGKPGPKAQLMKGDRSFGGWSWGDLSPEYYQHRPEFGFGDALVCFDLKRNHVAWKHREENGVQIDSRGIAIQENRIFFYCPDYYLKSLAADTGSFRWVNDDKDALGLIERQGKGLVSTPGFRTMCMMVASPEALVIQGQTRMNVVGISTADGRLLWKKDKITNNPNPIYVDGKFILGIGPRGSHVMLDPVTGTEEGNLGFLKRACTRLTASTDSLFVRGEGTLRYDLATRKALVDGSARPACNDGALPANGLLYLGPWQCDCNLSLIGAIARCSAGDFRFDHSARDGKRLAREPKFDQVTAPAAGPEDWETLRGDNARSGSSPARVVLPNGPLWQAPPAREFTPTAPTSAGGLIYLAGDDGKVRALDAASGAVKWEHLTPGPIKYPPTVWEGGAFVGCGDGQVYALEAATGRLLWRFRAAPVERHIMVYGRLASTWPVNSGVLVHAGTAYFAAGMIDYDGTYVYAVDAKTGELLWENNSSGHLNPELRKGVSVQGNLSILGGELLLAGGNQVSPARFDLQTGKLATPKPFDGNPTANNGNFVGVFRDTVITGGRILLSSPRNVSNKNWYDAVTGNRGFRFNMGGIPPAWNDGGLAFVNTKFGKLAHAAADTAAARIQKGYVNAGPRPAGPWSASLADSLERENELQWRADFGEKFEVLSLAVAPNAIVAVVRSQEMFRSQRQWWLAAFHPRDGRQLFRHELDAEPLPGGLLVDRRGHLVVTLLNGEVRAFGGRADASR